MNFKNFNIDLKINIYKYIKKNCLIPNALTIFIILFKCELNMQCKYLHRYKNTL